MASLLGSLTRALAPVAKMSGMPTIAQMAAESQVRTMATKQKTKSAVKKRFWVNSNGLVKRAKSNKRHINTKKSRERIRGLGQPAYIQNNKVRKNILGMLNMK